MANLDGVGEKGARETDQPWWRLVVRLDLRDPCSAAALGAGIIAS